MHPGDAAVAASTHFQTAQTPQQEPGANTKLKTFNKALSVILMIYNYRSNQHYCTADICLHIHSH